MCEMISIAVVTRRQRQASKRWRRSSAPCHRSPSATTHRREGGHKCGHTDFQTLQSIGKYTRFARSRACLGRRGAGLPAVAFGEGGSNPVAPRPSDNVTVPGRRRHLQAVEDPPILKRRRDRSTVCAPAGEDRVARVRQVKILSRQEGQGIWRRCRATSERRTDVPVGSILVVYIEEIPP